MLNIIAGNIGQPGGMTSPTNTTIPGIVKSQPSPFVDVQELIKQMNSGTIKVLLIHGANPAYDLPAQLGLKKPWQRSQWSFHSVQFRMRPPYYPT